jgi:putative MATE family efflux protein
MKNNETKMWIKIRALRIINRIKSAFRNQDVIFTLKLSAVAAASLALSNIHNFFGTMMVGHIGDKAAEQISAMGIALIIMLTFSAPMNAFGSSSQSLISQLWGKGKRREAFISFKSALLTSFALSSLMCILVFIFGEWFMKIIAPSQKVADYGKKFLFIRILGLPATAITFVMRGLFDAIGKPEEHLKFNAYSTLVCITLSYFFIFGIFFPRMELYGFALASTISSFVAAVHGAFLIRPYIKEYFSPQDISDIKYREDMLKFALKNLKISIPAFFAQFIASVSFLLFIWFSGLPGVEHQAVSFILVNIIGVIMLPAMAIGVSLAGMVGRLMGQNEIKRAKKILQDMIIVIGTASFALSFLMIIFPETSMRIFSNQKEVIEEGKKTILTFSPSIIFITLGILIINTLIGVGDTRFVVKVESILHFLFFIPSLFLFGTVLKSKSVVLWLIISIYFALLFFILLLRVKSGKWMKKLT